MYRFPTLPVAACCPVIKTAQLFSSKSRLIRTLRKSVTKSVVGLDQRTLWIGRGGNMKETDHFALLIYDFEFSLNVLICM